MAAAATDEGVAVAVYSRVVLDRTVRIGNGTIMAWSHSRERRRTAAATAAPRPRFLQQ